MRRHFLIVLLLCAIAIPYRAHGADIAQSLAKMDALIKEMQALRAEFAALAGAAPSVVTPSGSVLGAQTKTFFTQSLALGVTNSDIEKIQKLLATDPAIYPYGVVSGFFGPKTEEGVKNFQTRFGLAAVGVVGPSTKTLFELFFAAYPDDVYPNDVLQKKPTVLVASVSAIPATPAFVAVSAPANTSGISSITVIKDDEEAEVRVVYAGGTHKVFIVDGDSNTTIINAIADKINVSKSVILTLIQFKNSDDNDNQSGDATDAEDAIDSAQDAIDSVEEDIDDADNDVDTSDAEDALDEARDLLDDAENALDDEEYEDALDLAQEAEDMADEAVDELNDAEDAADEAEDAV